MQHKHTQKMKLKKKRRYLIHLVQPSTPMVEDFGSFRRNAGQRSLNKRKLILSTRLFVGLRFSRSTQATPSDSPAPEKIYGSPHHTQPTKCTQYFRVTPPEQFNICSLPRSLFAPNQLCKGDTYRLTIVKRSMLMQYLVNCLGGAVCVQVYSELLLLYI